MAMTVLVGDENFRQQSLARSALERYVGSALTFIQCEACGKFLCSDGWRHAASDELPIILTERIERKQCPSCETLVKKIREEYHFPVSETTPKKENQMFKVQCPACNALYDVEMDSWMPFTDHIDVALHSMCPACFREYVRSLDADGNPVKI